MYKKITAVLLIAGYSADANSETLLECAQIEDSAERVACYDRLAGRVEEKMEQKQEGTTQQRVEARTEAIAEEVVGAVEQPADVRGLEIGKVLRDRSKRVIYVTTDGRVFKRDSGSRITFRAGDKCELESGVMSSLFLVCGDGSKNKVEELATK